MPIHTLIDPDRVCLRWQDSMHCGEHATGSMCPLPGHRCPCKIQPCHSFARNESINSSSFTSATAENKDVLAVSGYYLVLTWGLSSGSMQSSMRRLRMASRLGSLSMSPGFWPR